MGKLEEFFNRKYKLILLIPLIVFIFSVIIIANFNAKHGDYVQKDVSLKGGVSATIYLDTDVDIGGVQSYLKNELNEDVSVRTLTTIEDVNQGFLVEASNINAEELKVILEKYLSMKLNDNNYFVEETGSKLGEDFYKQMVRAVVIAFVLMGITVFIIFRKIIPSIAVISSALLDIIGTIALIDIFGIKVSAAGVSALLLLIGYSVDTDILLTTRMIKRREGSIWERVMSAAKTGLTMTAAALAATGVGYFFAQSLVLKQMFSIIFLGLIVDVIATYFMNAGLLRWYLEKKEHG